MQISYLKPLYTKIVEGKLHLAFAYQHLSILKEDEQFHFIPLDGKEMVVNLKTYKIENVSDVFVFQNGSRFMRLPLHQLLLISNIYDYLLPIIEEKTVNNCDYNKDEINEEINYLMEEIMQFHQENLIDKLLDAKDFDNLKNLQQQVEYQLGFSTMCQKR
ncbi:transcriptional regulator [Metasolibacillus meyeri]|uniref:Transcriptional regulator n=1 Tax=Metasolibacillus meyeri TaxID=1071052 RepID=A0AAW9NLG4_9BACL|nr:transcriptional regulator [Metasolibacillus meyeri]MEC1177291.1 transcriptional regulator [Metasolibacillus meyeri]